MVDRSVLVVGAGAIGGVVAGRMAGRVRRVAVLDASAACVERLRSGGLLLEDDEGAQAIPLDAYASAGELRERMGRWSLFEPALLASFGVAMPFADTPPSLLIDGIAPFEAGGAWNGHLHLRLFNEGPEFAPAGHTVVQAMVRTDYDWWAQRGERYTDEKEVVADVVLAQIERHLPGVSAATRMRDVATPLTFWRSARAWRGAYEGWLPSPETFTTHLPRSLPGLGDFYMAGQWVEPGGGVPTALMSGRHVAQILCAAGRQEFIAPVPALEAKTG